MKKQILMLSFAVVSTGFANPRVAPEDMRNFIQDVVPVIKKAAQVSEAQQQRIEALLLLSICQKDKALSEAERAQCVQLQARLSEFLTDALNVEKPRTALGFLVQAAEQKIAEVEQEMTKAMAEEDAIDELDFGNDRED